MVFLLGVVSKIKAMFTVYRTAFRADTKTLRYSVHTYPISDRLHFRDRPGAAALQKTRAEITVLVNRSRIQYGFCADTKALRYNVKIVLILT